MRTLVKFTTRSLGDTIGGMPAVEAYQRKVGGDVYVNCAWEELVKDAYPNLLFTNRDYEFDSVVHTSYHFDKPLQAGFAGDLGFQEWSYRRPKISFKPGPRPINSKYVVVGIHTTAQCKYWNYPKGWDILCKELKKKGLLPVCVDQHETFGVPGSWNQVPKTAVKRLNNTIKGTMNFIHHAEFFLGVSSGLAWVAHAMGKRVVMISGVTETWNEFDEDCVRVINRDVCHGCFHKPQQYPFIASDWNWCPVHKGTERAFECSKTITPQKVLEQIEGAEWLRNEG